MKFSQRLAAIVVALQTLNVSGFSLKTDANRVKGLTRLHSGESNHVDYSVTDRRFFIRQMGGLAVTAALTSDSQKAFAADEVKKLDAAEQTEIVRSSLYYVLRVREATEQETRLIKSGKFKDVQRANVKLAVKFMMDNYRLSDNFIKASTFLSGNRKIQAVTAGQECIQNLQTITEYFDSSDVQNIKIGSNSIAGKESLVLNGLDASRKNIDLFLSFFNPEDVNAVQSKILAENELNEKEFDTALGAILNNPVKP